ncbi:phage tail assembly chaperone [Pseudomonas sp. NBRC 111142]|uniref:phage tail assembly chaperone n=1 Tax=Pseudomonas sp. NBRC 111142 TaxID=1661057 RepID=UPI0009EACAA4|nr:phage tail assembly chaperone [Pseudomonas sp. NBRC 111142]
MKRYYSQSTGCCYLEGVHKAVPPDAVEIDQKRYTDVIANPPLDKVRSHDEHGLPVLIDLPAPSMAAVADTERKWRDEQLAAYQWLRDRHRDEQDLGRTPTLTPARFAELLAYMQSLRDWPQSNHFPSSEERPLPPPWVLELTP